ncbi:transglycosylase SLT domain-containing protein [Geodermatophilus sp. DSM 44513]|uniref:aggregation-promoting factor C-terminal-like domain-containing protein n=1 Tax=Geodermatophilus sp. DSM 44513 TaxID=1528104 RepID=UPI001281C8F4|nr:transglycosylase SLT domain-containing protein [Geodermatophilus sp. DSM 44513]WNV73798.1 transglycosylase SLT domain-containing protein [Geodermatophilus sp. DSM 44513]
MDTQHLPAVPADQPATRAARRRSRPPGRRPAVLLATAAAGAVVVHTLLGGPPAAEAERPAETVTASVSVAEQLGITAEAAQRPLTAPAPPELAPLEDLAASRSDRAAAEAQAAQVQAAAEQAERDRLAAEQAAAERAAAEAAAREAAERAAAEAAAEAAAREEAAAAEREAAEREEATPAAAAPAAAPKSSSSAAPKGSFKEYALAQVGSAEQFSCLEELWGKESGWNPNAQNPTSTAYGIPQFLDSTWKSTGIAKTSDGYRQIDAGLVYIENRYGSPCGAWSHSQAKGWY